MWPSGAHPQDLSFLPVSTLDVALNRLDRVAGHAVRSGQQNVAHGRDEYEFGWRDVHRGPHSRRSGSAPEITVRPVSSEGPVADQGRNARNGWEILGAGVAQFRREGRWLETRCGTLQRRAPCSRQLYGQQHHWRARGCTLIAMADCLLARCIQSQFVARRRRPPCGGSIAPTWCGCPYTQVLFKVSLASHRKQRGPVACVQAAVQRDEFRQRIISRVKIGGGLFQHPGEPSDHFEGGLMTLPLVLIDPRASWVFSMSNLQTE